MKQLLRLKKQILALLIILSISFPLSLLAEQIVQPRGEVEFSGRVYSSDDGLPVSGATVRCDLCGTATSTGTEGEFTLRIPIESDFYTIRISFVGFRTITHQAGRDSELTGLQFYLEAVVESLSPVTVLSYRLPGSPASDLSTDQSALLPIDSGVFLREAANASGIRRGGFGIDPVIRGLSGSRLNIRVDGLTTTAAACPNRMDPPTSHIRLTDIERIEIHRGPHALEYGPSFGGTVNFISQKQEQYSSPGLSGDLRAGFESNTGHRKSDMRLFGGNNLGYLVLNGGLSATGDYTSGSGAVIPAGFSSQDYGLELGWNITEEQRASISWSQSFIRDADFPSLAMDMAVDDTWKMKAGYAWKPIESTLIDQFSLNGYWSLVDHEMNNHRRSSFEMRDAVALAETKTWGIHARSGGVFSSGKWRVAAGMDHQNVSGTRFVGFKTGPMAGMNTTYNLWQDASLFNAGLFAGTEHYAEGWTISAGLRTDLNRADAGDPAPRFQERSLRSDHFNLSASAGVTRSLSPDASLGLFIGRGVRSPDITERYINFLTIGRDGFEYAGNPDLSPEANLQTDLVWQQRTERVRVDATLFASHMSNYISAILAPDIDPVGMGAPGVRLFSNRGNALFLGFELEGEVGFDGGWYTAGSLAFTRAEYRDSGTPVAEIPPLEAGLKGGGQLIGGRLSHEISLRYVFEQNRFDEAFGESRTPAFFIADISLRAEISERIRLSGGVRNLFDESYYEHLNRRFNPGVDPAGAMLQEPGRRIYAELSITF